MNCYLHPDHWNATNEKVGEKGGWKKTTQHGRHDLGRELRNDPSVCVLRESRQNRTNFSRVKGVCVLETAKEAIEQKEGRGVCYEKTTEQNEEGIVHVCVCVCVYVLQGDKQNRTRTNINE